MGPRAHWLDPMVEVGRVGPGAVACLEHAHVKRLDLGEVISLLKTVDRGVGGKDCLYCFLQLLVSLCLF